jgi:hypothetical protein
MKLLNVAKILVVLGMICGLNQNAHAQAEKIGNGGRAVVCSNSNGSLQSAELMDLYEGRTIREINVDSSLLTLSRDQLFEFISKKLISLDPISGPVLVEKARLVLLDINALELGSRSPTNMVRFLSDHIAEVNDSFEIFIPKNCSVEQFIIQRLPVYSEDRLLNIQKDIWAKLNSVNQIASIFHEILLNRAVFDFGVNNSVGSRYLISRLFSETPFTRKEYIKNSFNGGVSIIPTQEEVLKPSLYSWDHIQANFYVVKKTLEIYQMYKSLGYLNSVKVGKCFLEGFAGGGSYDNFQPTEYRVWSSQNKLDRKNRPIGPLFSETFYNESGWLKIAEILNSGKCD